jgi:hypothetical protein
MIALITFQIVVFIAYIKSIVWRYGVLPSISDSWYALPSKWNFLFTLFLWSLGVSMCLYGTPWYIYGGVCLCFCGAAARFKDRITKTVHFVGAVGGIILPLSALLLQGVVFPLCVVLMSTVIIKDFRIPNGTWWIEIIAFFSIILGLICAL